MWLQEPSTKDIEPFPCCQVNVAKLSGRTDSESRRVGSAAVDGGRYTQGPIMSQHTLSKKIHRSCSPQISCKKPPNLIVQPGFLAALNAIFLFARQLNNTVSRESRLQIRFCLSIKVLRRRSFDHRSDKIWPYPSNRMRIGRWAAAQKHLTF